MSKLMTTIETAALLGVTPSILREWETQFAFPRSVSARGGRRRFPRDEVMALRAALAGTSSVAQAVAEARAVVDRRRSYGSAGGNGHHGGPTRLAAS